MASVRCAVQYTVTPAAMPALLLGLLGHTSGMGTCISCMHQAKVLGLQMCSIALGSSQAYSQQRLALFCMPHHCEAWPQCQNKAQLGFAGSSARQNSASQTDAAQAAAPAQPAASQTPANGAAGADEQVLDADADAIAATVAAAIGRMSAADPTAGPRIAEAVRSAAQGTSEQAQPSESATQPQVDIAQSQSNAGAATEAAAGETASAARQSASTARPSASAAREPASDGRSGDGHRRRRRRAAISPVVTMALGSLLQTTLQGDAFQDPANVLSNAAQLLLTTHSFDRDHRTQVLVSTSVWQLAAVIASSHERSACKLLRQVLRCHIACIISYACNIFPLCSWAHQADCSIPASLTPV